MLQRTPSTELSAVQTPRLRRLPWRSLLLLALVIGLQGRFDESRQLFAAELPPAQVEANMNYIRALLTQQNRWDLIKGAG